MAWISLCAANIINCCCVNCVECDDDDDGNDNCGVIDVVVIVDDKEADDVDVGNFLLISFESISFINDNSLCFFPICSIFFCCNDDGDVDDDGGVDDMDG